jgi:hypothetical protein
LQSEAFPLAIDLAHIDAVLEPDVLEYWDAQVAVAMEQAQAQGHREVPSRRRRRRK